MGTKVSKSQGDTASKRVRAVAAFQLAGKNNKLMRAVDKNKANAAATKSIQKGDLKLPPRPPGLSAVANHACIEASSSCGFPIPAMIETKMNVNAKHGGGTALLFLTRAKSDSDSSEITLLRCGFDGNHFSIQSLAQGGEHSIYNWNEVLTNRCGDVQPKLIFGEAHAMIISNIASFGHGGCGVLIEGPKAGSSDLTASIKPKPDIYTTCEEMGSCVLVICSSEPNRAGAVPSQTYMVHFHRNGKVKQVPLISDGNDFWTITSNGGVLELHGPSRSHYTIFHSKNSEFEAAHHDKPRGKVVHLQAFSGINETTLFKDASRYVGRSMLLMCSHSLQDENSTTSALYQVTIMKGQVNVAYVAGLSGVHQSADVWTITLINNRTLVIVGPAGPCRYALFTNIPEDVLDPQERCFQHGCLATGLAENIQGGLSVGDTITVWVDSLSKVLVTCNGVTIQQVEGGDWIEQPDGRLAFQRELTDAEKSPGLRVYRAFAVLQDMAGADVSIELGGSPLRVITQPPGVAFALNCGGPDYQALNDVIFNDTETMYKRYDDEGLFCVRKFNCETPASRNLHCVIGNTYDTYLHSTHTRTHNGFSNEFKYPLNIPQGNYTLRLYSTGQGLMKATLADDNGSFTNKVMQQLNAIPEPGLTGKVCEVPISVGSGGNNLYFKTAGKDVTVSGILVYDKNFKEPKPSPEEEQAEYKIKQELADKLLPLNRTYSLKKMKIAGWSQNLLENASGESGTMENWNYGGDFKVADGGDGTEKKFVTSCMPCTKSQDIFLTTHFSEKHLDTAPEIQVSESFHEGCNKGGFYTFKVTLLDADSNVIASKTTGKKGSISTPGWIRESFTFTDYGPGVRSINFESSGQDDKYWAGHFGTYISAGVVRVKNEISTASGDAYADVDGISVEDRKHQVGGILREFSDTYKEGLERLKTLKGTHRDEAKKSQAAADQAGKSQTELRQSIRAPLRPAKREIRIFVSSTFRDFEEEREALIKKVFRELNRLCLDRGVFFTYVDLRWGITEEQTKNGKTIEICLREVDKCRPYFICLLGDRYGWSQTEKKKDELLNKSYDYAVLSQPELKWVDEYRYDCSVTKLEVLHGALRPHDKTKKNCVFFYLRNPRVKREDLPEPPVEEEPTEDKEEEDEEEKKPKGETQWHFDQQQKVRNTILESGYTCRNFDGATDGSAVIKEDLVQCINEEFPPGMNLTNLQRESEAHNAFADARRRVYIGRQEYFDFIDEYFAESPKVPLTIIGASGSGKSALIANWCGRFEEKNPGTFLFMHFIGSSAESASHLNLLRRLYGEMKQFYNLDLDVPTSDRNLVIDLLSWLTIAGKRSKVMLVLDALNQLDAGAGGTGDDKSLNWLPRTMPPNVYLLLSTLPGQAEDAVRELKWPRYKVEPLQEKEKLDIITGYMDLYGKTLNKEQTDLILNAEQSSNPLYLKALLDEVRMYGSFSQLTTAIKSYLTADDPGALFGKILERLEADFEKGDISRPGLVRETTTAIWCSHRGMSENEILTLLKVPSLIWSPFYLSLEENLINRNGVVNFFHDHLRQAVEARYLPTPEDKRLGYLKLANFFNAQDIDTRYADEVPYLLSQAGELPRLRATILNVNVFLLMMRTMEGNYQLIKAWRLLGGFEPVEQAYLDVLSRSEAWEQSMDKVELIKSMAVFFTQLGLLRGARVLNERLLKEIELRYLAENSTIVQHHSSYRTKHRCNHPTVIDVLIELGNVCQKQGNLSAAEEHLEDALTRLTKVRTPQQKLQLVKALIGMGSVKRRLGEADFARKFLHRAFEVSTEVLGHEHHYTAALVGQLGELCYDQSRLEEAMLFYTFDLQETQKEGGLDHPHVAAILNNIGLAQDDMQEDAAGETFRLALGILLEAYGKDHVDVATVRYNLGAWFFGSNMYKKATYQFEEAYRVFKLFNDDDHPSSKAALKAIKMVEGL